jgi:hypothetical protein
MTDTLELDYAIKRAGLDREKVASKMGISITTLFNKLHNKVEFKVSEIVKLKTMLNLNQEQTNLIFFANFVDEESTKTKEVSHE